MYDGLSSETCNAIKAAAMNYKEEVGRVGGVVDRQTSPIRKAQVRFIPLLNPINDDFVSVYAMLDTYVKMANRDYFGFDISNVPQSNIQFTQYGDWNQGEYNWHHDVFWIHTDTQTLSQRKISLVIQLDDPKNYDGGDFEFHPDDLYGKNGHPDKEKLREQGTILVFPSFIRHRVTPVTRGVRHSLVYWQEGPLWR